MELKKLWKVDFDIGTGKFMPNGNFGNKGRCSGFNMNVLSRTSSKDPTARNTLNIVMFTFKDRQSYDDFKRKIMKVFFGGGKGNFTKIKK